MAGAIVSLLLVVAAAYAVTQIGGVITLLFIAAVLFLAYRRLSLLAFTVTFTVLLAAYTVLGAASSPAGIWKGLLWVLLAIAVAPEPATDAQGADHPSIHEGLPEAPAPDVADREGGARGGHGVVGRGAVHRRAQLGEAACRRSAPRLTAEEQTFIDGPCEELCAMLDDWNITHERGDMPPAVWEFLKSRGFFAMIIPKKYGGLEFSAYGHSCVLAKIASRSATASSTVAVPELPGPRRAPQPLRHRGAEELLPAAPGARRGSAVLRAHRAARRLRRRLDSGHRHRVPRPVGRGSEVIGPEAQLQQALHHARAGGDRHRARVPHVRPGAPAGRQGRHRHHLRADPAPHPGSEHRAPSLPAQRAVPERADPWQGRVRAAGLHHRRPGDGGQRLAHAGRAALGRPLHLAALQHHRRRQGGGVGDGRLRAHPHAVQHAGGTLRGRRDRSSRAWWD